MPRGSSEQKGSSFLYISNKNSSDKKTQSNLLSGAGIAMDDENSERTIVTNHLTDVKEKLLLVMIFVVLVGYGEVA